ncbi:MAG: ABC transporter permease [Candidatus Bathyarchaeia archaeon]|nr:ABC transporter permease [Candidatus Bathyarchaeota archaeon A05DMB-4]MDH7595284.1 ABC transporter permease [Candidatus Bathyarchaeota archaeon]
MKTILYVVERDFKYFFRYKWWIAGMISMNLADLLIMAVVYTGMVSQEITQQYVSYFVFFAPGLTITALFAAAFMIGREINMEVRREISHYMLSLPIKRWELAIGRVLAGGFRGLVYMTPLLITTITITHVFTNVVPSPLQLLSIVAALLFISIGTSGLSISLAISTTSFEKYITARSVVYYVLFFCSTVFYPIDLIQSALPQTLALVAQYNPLSAGADLSRAFLLGYPPFSAFMFLDVVAFGLVFALVAMLAYMKVTQK